MGIVETITGLKRISTEVVLPPKVDGIAFVTKFTSLFDRNNVIGEKTKYFNDTNGLASRLERKLFEPLVSGLSTCVTGVALVSAGIYSEAYFPSAPNSASAAMITTGLAAFRAGVEVLNLYRVERSRLEALIELGWGN